VPVADMLFRPLGTTGLNVSVVGLGCNNFGMKLGEDASRDVVWAALDAGINLFDTAASYGTSEERLGTALGARRDEVVVATKFPSPADTHHHAIGSRHHVIASCEGSLRRLGTDHIDLLQMHRPDPQTPIEETLRALDDLVRSGKVRYIGSSNFAAWQIADAHWTARAHGLAHMVSAQNEYSLVRRDVEFDVIPACLHYGVALLPFFPLAAGPPDGEVQAGRGARGHRADERRQPNEPAGGALPYGPQLQDCRRSSEAGYRRRRHALAAGHRRTGGAAVSSVIAGATTPEQVVVKVAAGTWDPRPRCSKRSTR
jgi:aryl-alcohol dehydrogenase-like predicted oxidoreductase